MFTWICPKCKREVPPAYTDCPTCNPQSVAGGAPPPRRPAAPPTPTYPQPPYAAPPPQAGYPGPPQPGYGAPPQPPPPAPPYGSQIPRQPYPGQQPADPALSATQSGVRRRPIWQAGETPADAPPYAAQQPAYDQPAFNPPQPPPPYAPPQPPYEQPAYAQPQAYYAPAPPEPPLAQPYYAPPPPSTPEPPPAAAPQSTEWSAPAPPVKTPLPTALVAVLSTVGFAVLIIGIYSLVGSHSSKPAATSAASTDIATPPPGAKDNPYWKFVEISGMRFAEDPKDKDKTIVKFVVTNHADDDMHGLSGTVAVLKRGDAGSGAVAGFTFTTSLGPGESKDLTTTLTTAKKIYELPNWQDAQPVLQITAPAGASSGSQ